MNARHYSAHVLTEAVDTCSRSLYNRSSEQLEWLIIHTYSLLSNRARSLFATTGGDAFSYSVI